MLFPCSTLVWVRSKTQQMLYASSTPEILNFLVSQSLKYICKYPLNYMHRVKPCGCRVIGLYAACAAPLFDNDMQASTDTTRFLDKQKNRVPKTLHPLSPSSASFQFSSLYILAWLKSCGVGEWVRYRRTLHAWTLNRPSKNMALPLYAKNIISK
jgi:hypothetical protein